MTHMQLNFDNLTFVVGNTDSIKQMEIVKPLQPFSNEVIAFLNDLSKKAMRFGKEYSDVATFGFWCRRSALLQEKKKYDDISDRLGRGIVFHNAPSNVPVNFAFSFAAGLLAGNANIVRLPAKDFEQTTMICKFINELLADSHKNMASYICMVKYSSAPEITDIFSSICDTRMIWGGDDTILRMRKSPLKPRANEITFADRHSIMIINADQYLLENDLDAITHGFYNDTFFSDQNACTAPRIIIWIGDEKEKAKAMFWDRAHKLVKEKYTLTAVQSVGKLAAFYKIASQRPVKLIKSDDGLIMRIMVDVLDERIMDYKYNSGFFFEYDAIHLQEILPLCSEKCQTLTYFGLSQEEIKAFFEEHRPRGVDRALPIGKSMDFSLVWDGHDLIRSLSRKVTIL